MNKILRLGLTTMAIIFLALGSPTTAKAATYNIPEGYDKYGALKEEMFYDDLTLLACVVWAEAGNQDLRGKELVVDVVLNRVDDDSFPDTIREVIFQKGQFSTVTDGALEKAYWNMTDDCYNAVRNELCGRNDYEALFFCSLGYNYYGEPMYKYGDHYFSKKEEA